MENTMLKSLSAILCGLFLTAPLAFSQEFSHEFGKYSAEDFTMKKYDKDPDAEAVIIYDIGSSRFGLTDDGFDLFFERKIKFKVFSKAGLKWAQFEIPYYTDSREFEGIYDFEGNTYNYENGSVKTTKLNPKNSYEETINEHWKVKKFAMPNVKEGSVIEITYKIRSPYLFNLRDWDFQYTIPVIYSKYTTMMIPFYEYTYIMQGASKFDKFDSYESPGLPNRFRGIDYKDMVYEFIMQDVPAFKDEGFMTSINDYKIRMNFQLSVFHKLDGTNKPIMSTWPKLIEEVLDHESFGKFLKASQRNAKSIADTMNAMNRTEMEKSEIINKYVKANFNWNGQRYVFADKTVKEFLKTKTGNSAAINLYLAGTLAALGIEAFPVLISTRDHGKIPLDYPFLDFFNYVIVMAKIDNRYVMLDATDPMIPFGKIPTRCINEKGLIVNKAKTEWTYFNNMGVSTWANNFDLTLNGTKDSISIACDAMASGYDALNLRKAYLSNPNDFKEELFEEQLPVSDSFRVKNTNQVEKPFEISFRAQIACENVGDKLLISPFCGQAMTSNPFKQVYRTYPIDMVYKKERKFTTTIHVPSGYKIAHKPEDLAIKNNHTEILYKTETIDNNTIKVSGSYMFKKEIYDASEYSFIKGYFNKIIDKFNEKVVLAKE